MIYDFKKFKRQLNEGFFGSKEEAPYGEFEKKHVIQIEGRKRRDFRDLEEQFNGEAISVNYVVGKGTEREFMSRTDFVLNVGIERERKWDNRGYMKGSGVIFSISGMSGGQNFRISCGRNNKWGFFKSAGISLPEDSIQTIIDMARKIYDSVGESLPDAFLMNIDKFSSIEEVSINS